MSGNQLTTPRPRSPTPHAAATAYQRKRQALRASERICCTISCMRNSPLEHGFRNDDDVAGPHHDVPLDLASIHEIGETHACLLAAPVDVSNEARAVAGSEFR